MRILILNWKDVRHPDVGGAEIIAFELARRLAAEHEVTWFCRAFSGCAAEETNDGIRIVRRGGLLTTYLHAAAFYRRLDPKPDVVLDMVNVLCWQTPLYARGRAAGYANQLGRRVLLYELRPPLSWLAYALEGLQYRTYRRTPFLCYSESTRSDLAEVGIPPENIRAFPLGVDHSRYFPAGEKAPAPLFLFVGRLVRMKRADVCVRAMQHVLRRRPDAHLAIVGYGPEERRIRKLVAALGLEHAVSLVTRDALFFDRVPGDRKVELMRRAWVHVLPSVKEGWGMVVTEAAACGTPSIVSDVTGLRDSVRAGETGLVVSANPSAEELADAMVRLADDEDLRRRLSAGALAWAARFDWETSFERFRSQLFAATERSELASTAPSEAR